MQETPAIGPGLLQSPYNTRGRQERDGGQQDEVAIRPMAIVKLNTEAHNGCRDVG